MDYVTYPTKAITFPGSFTFFDGNFTTFGNRVIEERPETAISLTSNIIISVVIIFLLLFGSTGNILTLIAIFKNKNLQVPSNYIIISLCISDLISALLCSPLWLYRTTWGFSKWEWGMKTCQLYWIVDFTTNISTSLHILSFSVVRFIVVKRPFIANSISMKRVLCLIFVLWTLAFLLTLPLFWLIDVNWNRKLDSIGRDWPSCSIAVNILDSCCVSQYNVYMIIISPFLFFLPQVLVIILSASIAKVMLDRRKWMKSLFNVYNITDQVQRIGEGGSRESSGRSHTPIVRSLRKQRSWSVVFEKFSLKKKLKNQSFEDDQRTGNNKNNKSQIFSNVSAKTLSQNNEKFVKKSPNYFKESNNSHDVYNTVVSQDKDERKNFYAVHDENSSNLEGKITSEVIETNSYREQKAFTQHEANNVTQHGPFSVNNLFAKEKNKQWINYGTFQVRRQKFDEGVQESVEKISKISSFSCHDKEDSGNNCCETRLDKLLFKASHENEVHDGSNKTITIKNSASEFINVSNEITNVETTQTFDRNIKTQSNSIPKQTAHVGDNFNYISQLKEESLNDESRQLSREEQTKQFSKQTLSDLKKNFKLSASLQIDDKVHTHSVSSLNKLKNQYKEKSSELQISSCPIGENDNVNKKVCVNKDANKNISNEFNNIKKESNSSQHPINLQEIGSNLIKDAEEDVSPGSKNLISKKSILELTTESDANVLEKSFIFDYIKSKSSRKLCLLTRRQDFTLPEKDHDQKAITDNTKKSESVKSRRNSLYPQTELFFNTILEEEEEEKDNVKQPSSLSQPNKTKNHSLLLQNPTEHHRKESAASLNPKNNSFYKRQRCATLASERSDVDPSSQRRVSTASVALERQYQQEKSTFRQLILVNVSFILGYVPITSYLLWTSSVPSDSLIDYWFGVAAYFCLRLSECLNPVIYNLASSNIGTATRKLLRSIFQSGETN